MEGVTKSITLNDLKKIKLESAVRRLKIAYYCSIVLGTINLTAEFFFIGLYKNYIGKILVVGCYGLLIFINNWISKDKRLAKVFSFILGEILNCLMIYLAYIKEPEYRIIWIQLASFIVMYYQANLLENIQQMILLSLKHTFLWTSAFCYFSKSSVNFKPCAWMAVVGLFCLIFFDSYLSHLQDLDIIISKDRVKEANKKLNKILDAIPKCVLVLSENLNLEFFNSTLKALILEESIIDYLGSIKYYMRFQKGSIDTQILEDIKSSLKLCIGTTVVYGITENYGNLVEWSAKIETWEERKVVILFGKDVTETIKLQKESEENKYKSALLRTVSHELRTPTSAMLAMAQCLLDSKELSKENQERVNIMSSSCAYLLCLINDLLDYAQIMAGCLKILKIPFNLTQLLEECLKVVQVEINQDRVKSETKFLTSIPEEIISDPYRLKQVIINLLGSAKKFTKNGFIILEVSYSSPRLTVSCKDSGAGIEKEKQSGLFCQFGKLEDTVLNPQGVGLGLYISNMLIRELGGSGIKVDSVIGQGSTFTFEIVIEESKNSPSSSDVAEENANINLPYNTLAKLMEKTKILIVDDTYFNILAYIQIFKLEGINCSYALDGAEAISKIKNNKYDCVIMDCEMPILDGWEATKTLKEMLNSGEILKLPPIIGATAHDSDAIKYKCIEAGMDDILFKPCPRKDIINKVMHWIQASKFL
jgi:signal transduction histidine kinase/CheY-like chemotaxis protein